MRASTWTITILALTIFSMTSAMAGPTVTVTFKNLGTKDATYTVTNNNEASTRNNSNPTPTSPIKADQSNNYKVQSRTSPDANFASLRYKMAARSVFIQLLSWRLQVQEAPRFQDGRSLLLRVAVLSALSQSCPETSELMNGQCKSP